MRLIPLPAHPLIWLSVSRQRQEYKVFQQLLKMVPRLPERLMEKSEEECMMIADLVSVSFYSSDSLLDHASSIGDSKGHSEREVR